MRGQAVSSDGTGGLERGSHAAQVAVLFSGGLDSAVLAARSGAAGRRAADLRQRGSGVGGDRSAPRPSNCSCARVRAGAFGPLVSLTVDMRDVYPPTHWAIRGEPPAFDTPDEDVYLDRPQHRPPRRRRASTARATGSIASRWGRSRAIRFRTRRRTFFAAMARALSLGLAQSIARRRALRRGCTKLTSCGSGIALGVPLELTLSCMNPERRAALRRVQQVPRATDAFSRSRCGSDRIRRTGAVVANRLVWKLGCWS